MDKILVEDLTSELDDDIEISQSGSGLNLESLVESTEVEFLKGSEISIKDQDSLVLLSLNEEIKFENSIGTTLEVEAIKDVITSSKKSLKMTKRNKVQINDNSKPVNWVDLIFEDLGKIRRLNVLNDVDLVDKSISRSRLLKCQFYTSFSLSIIAVLEILAWFILQSNGPTLPVVIQPTLQKEGKNKPVN